MRSMLRVPSVSPLVDVLARSEDQDEDQDEEDQASDADIHVSALLPGGVDECCVNTCVVGLAESSADISAGQGPQDQNCAGHGGHGGEVIYIDLGKPVREVDAVEG